MKHKIVVDFVEIEKLEGDFTEVGERSSSRTGTCREAVAPKIVVCPPMEEIIEPMSASPRGGRLLRAISKRLSRRSRDDDSLGSSSSSDSVSCDTRTDDRSSLSASDSGSDSSERHRRHRSTVSLRRVFQSLSLTSRSHSSSPTDRQRQPKKQQQPKRILRTPVTYTYVRGLSGLPTQRVPRHTVNMHNASMGLNR